MIGRVSKGTELARKWFATVWEFSFYRQKKVADYEYAKKIHFHTLIFIFKVPFFSKYTYIKNLIIFSAKTQHLRKKSTLKMKNWV